MSDDERDPFEELDSGEDREGDPFERLDPGSDDGETEGDAPQPDEPLSKGDTDTSADAHRVPGDGRQGGESSDEPVDGVSVTGPGDDDLLSAVDTAEFQSDSPTEDSPRSGPAPDPDDPFSEMDDRGEDPFEGGESAFERVDIDRIDTDKVWAEVAADDDSEASPESRYAEVSKHRYCEGCEYFSPPPNVHCTNEGTEIMEFLDMETVRLLNCPVVAEQREIEDEQ